MTLIELAFQGVVGAIPGAVVGASHSRTLAGAVWAAALGCVLGPTLFLVVLASGKARHRTDDPKRRDDT